MIIERGKTSWSEAFSIDIAASKLFIRLVISISFTAPIAFNTKLKRNIAFQKLENVLFTWKKSIAAERSYTDAFLLQQRYSILVRAYSPAEVFYMTLEMSLQQVAKKGSKLHCSFSNIL